MTAKHTQHTTIYVVACKVGARLSPFYRFGWQFHSVHEDYHTALDSANGWCRQGGKACAAIFSWSQASGFELVSLSGEEIGSYEAINAHRIIPSIAVEQYHEMMRNVAQQVTGREYQAGAIRSPLDVADATAAAAADARCPDCGGAAGKDHVDGCCESCVGARLLAAVPRCPVEADPAAAPPYKIGDRCPRCTSPSPELHPAVQYEGEVQPCSHPYHNRGEPRCKWSCPGCGRTVGANTVPKSRLCLHCQENARSNPDSYIAT